MTVKGYVGRIAAAVNRNRAIILLVRVEQQ